MWCISQMILANSQVRKYISSISCLPDIFFIFFLPVECSAAFNFKIHNFVLHEKQNNSQSMLVISHLYLKMNFIQPDSSSKDVCL